MKLSKKDKKLIELYIRKVAIDCSLYFRPSRKLALISGAGIAGLVASFELLSRGFNVVIAEKRTSFDRFNLINLDVETQRFLKNFGLLDEFEKDIAGRISRHEIVFYDGISMPSLDSSDVRKLKPSIEPFKPDNLDKFFKKGGVYSVKIKDLQNFLAKKALEAGVHIFGNTEIEVSARTEAGGVSKVLITRREVLQPHLLFLAEGAHSTTAKKLGMSATEVINECTGENWIFGNVKYHGQETFVVSAIDTSQNRVEIANIIFNAKIGEINIAVTSEKHLAEQPIKDRILATLKRVFNFMELGEPPQALISVVKHPVHVKNEQRDMYSRGNVFCIGDAAGHSSPLAGLGGTLGLTLVPRIMAKLLYDHERSAQNLHHNFNLFSDASTSKWIKKSQEIKSHCISFFESKKCSPGKQEQASNNKNAPSI